MDAMENPESYAGVGGAIHQEVAEILGVASEQRRRAAKLDELESNCPEARRARQIAHWLGQLAEEKADLIPSTGEDAKTLELKKTLFDKAKASFHKENDLEFDEFNPRGVSVQQVADPGKGAFVRCWKWVPEDEEAV